jgi:Na+(H+)/acetate symporter ActP
VSGQRICIGVIAIASVVALCCAFLSATAAGIAFGVAALFFPPALIGLGVSRGGRVGTLRGFLVAFALFLQLCLAAMLLLGGRADSESWWLGFPPATAMMLYGLWLSPLLIVALIYAWHFEREGLTDDDLHRLRDLVHRAHRDGGER